MTGEDESREVEHQSKDVEGVGIARRRLFAGVAGALLISALGAPPVRAEGELAALFETLYRTDIGFQDKLKTPCPSSTYPAYSDKASALASNLEEAGIFPAFTSAGGDPLNLVLAMIDSGFWLKLEDLNNGLAGGGEG